MENETIIKNKTNTMEKMNPQPFLCSEPYDIWPTGSHLRKSSQGANWPSLFAAMRTTTKLEGHFEPIEAHVVTVILNRPIQFEGRLGNVSEGRVLFPGDFTFTPSGTDFNIKVKSEYCSYDTIHLYIRPSLFEEVYAKMFKTAEHLALKPYLGATDPMILGISSEIQNLLLSPRSSDQIYIESLAHSLACRVVHTQAFGREGEFQSIKEEAPNYFSRAVQYIDAHLDSRLNLEKIAKNMGINAERLTREFKKNGDLAPYEFIVRERVKRAKHLLNFTDLTLAEIALRSGFCDQQHMSHTVRRYTGLTPGSIRKTQQLTQRVLQRE